MVRGTNACFQVWSTSASQVKASHLAEVWEEWNFRLWKASLVLNCIPQIPMNCLHYEEITDDNLISENEVHLERRIWNIVFDDFGARGRPENNGRYVLTNIIICRSIGKILVIRAVLWIFPVSGKIIKSHFTYFFPVLSLEVK